MGFQKISDGQSDKAKRKQRINSKRDKKQIQIWRKNNGGQK